MSKCIILINFDYILETMPDADQVPINQAQLPHSSSARIVTVRRTKNGNDFKVFDYIFRRIIYFVTGNKFTNITLAIQD